MIVLAKRKPLNMRRLDEDNDTGQVAECSNCHKEVVLPYVDDTKQSVYLHPLDGWEGPPLICPECAKERF